MCIFAEGKNNCSHQCLHWWQELSTGQFHVNGFESRFLDGKIKEEAAGLLFYFWCGQQDSNLHAFGSGT